jgi:phosphinothricin acetyltransferase
MSNHVKASESSPASIPEAVSVDGITASDWPAVCSIYAEGIATGNATFETSTPEWEKWNAGQSKTCRYVARHGGEILGWAALSPVSGRSVYAGVAEVSVYAAAAARGHKVGSHLLEKLIESSENDGIWTLQAGTFPENIASLKLHEKHGFRVVGIRERLGRLQGRWRDVVLMERRTKVAGI